jgi:hypothetical protein
MYEILNLSQCQVSFYANDLILIPPNSVNNEEVDKLNKQHNKAFSFFHLGYLFMNLSL